MAVGIGIMAGKRGLIMGIANERSIAWGIAAAAVTQGATLALTYQGDSIYKRIMPLAAKLNAIVLPCDVSDPQSLTALFSHLEQEWGSLDFVVHAVAFSDKEELKGRFIDLSFENFMLSMNISCYSFTAVAKAAEKLMPNGGSLLTLTYHGAQRVVPHYNVMGVAKAALEASVRYLAEDVGKKKIRVNALSAGPVKTLAASGIGDFRLILKWHEYNSPLRRNVTIEEIGNSAVYLLSDLSSAVTGEIHNVDCGYNVVGMKASDAPDIALVEPSL